MMPTVRFAPILVPVVVQVASEKINSLPVPYSTELPSQFPGDPQEPLAPPVQVDWAWACDAAKHENSAKEEATARRRRIGLQSWFFMEYVV